MHKNQVEKYIAAFLFIAVLVAFSYAEEESKKIQKLYVTASPQDNLPQPTRMALVQTSVTKD